jgi:hypothetical protein
MSNQQKHSEHRNQFYTIDGVQFEGSDKASFTKGKVRSVGEVLEDAKLRLKDSGIDDGGIDLTFDDSILRLQGWVGNLADKRRAEELLMGLLGVEQVINELFVDSNTTLQDVQGGISADQQRDVDLKLHKDVI